MKTIAVIDDDIYIGDLLEEVLTGAGYRVLRAYSGTEALYLLGENHPDLILLDLMLPGLSGEDVLTKVRDIPVIVVSAKVDVADKVSLLTSGAADYVTKPFNTDELLARIQANLRKAEKISASTILSAGDLWMDTDSHAVTAGGISVHLTRTEYAILKLLMANPGQVIARSVMLDRISLDTPDCTDSSLRQHMSNLRKKLRLAGGREYIDAVWGIGFKLDVGLQSQTAPGLY